MATARKVLAEAEESLARSGIPSPRVDAELLLAHIMGRERIMLRLADPTLDQDQVDRFEAAVRDREQRVPLQHITGQAHFRHLSLRVGPGVFIPRPETEVMVGAAVAHLTARLAEAAPPSAATRWQVSRPPMRGTHSASIRPLVVDLCTGSGAIALSLALEVPGIDVVAVELAATSMAWAEANVGAAAAPLHQAGSEVQLVAGDAATVAEAGAPLHHLRERVDLLISNPPYVPTGMVPRDAEVRDHDPEAALYGGADGLTVIRGIARQATLLLAPGGLFLVEHADVQGEDGGALSVPSLLRRALLDGDPVWRDVVDHPDLAGRPRFTAAVRTDRTA